MQTKCMDLKITMLSKGNQAETVRVAGTHSRGVHRRRKRRVALHGVRVVRGQATEGQARVPRVLPLVFVSVRTPIKLYVYFVKAHPVPHEGFTVFSECVLSFSGGVFKVTRHLVSSPRPSEPDTGTPVAPEDADGTMHQARDGQ